MRGGHSISRTSLFEKLRLSLVARSLSSLSHDSFTVDCCSADEKTDGDAYFGGSSAACAAGRGVAGWPRAAVRRVRWVRAM